MNVRLNVYPNTSWKTVSSVQRCRAAFATTPTRHKALRSAQLQFLTFPASDFQAQNQEVNPLIEPEKKMCEPLRSSSPHSQSRPPLRAWHSSSGQTAGPPPPRPAPEPHGWPITVPRSGEESWLGERIQWQRSNLRMIREPRENRAT